MLSTYGPVLLFTLVAAAMPVLLILVSRRLAPKKPLPAKYDAYECGPESIGSAHTQFKTQFYLYALIFVIFDVEAVFLIPWAVAFRKMGPLAMVEMLIFMAFLALALAYAWRKRALEWK